MLALSADRRGWLNVQPLQLSLHRPGHLWTLLIAGAILATGCGGPPPELTALDPPTGHPHEVVFVQGTERESAQIVWDAGTTDETIIPGGFKGAFMFSVPDDAMPGTTHAIALQNKSGRSKTVTFTIPMMPGPDDLPRPRGHPHEFPAPRIDAVMLIGAAFDSSGVSTTLYVQGANLDVGATISMKTSSGEEPSEIAAASHKVLRNDWYGVSHNDLSYPIYHYSSAVVVPGILMPGQRIWLVATNLGGTKSRDFEYVLPADAATLDSDGDGLRDTWETSGYHADNDGVVDVDLPALGADPYRRDVFVELDIMDNLKNRPDRDKNGNFDTTVFDALQQMFESAPILNFGDAQGIHLVIDYSGKTCLVKPEGGDLCVFNTIHFDIGGQISGKTEPDPFGMENEVRFSLLKKHNFDDERRGDIYHYGIWGRWQDNKLSGFSDRADDFVIAFDEYGSTYYTVRSNIEALAHELGHNLGQRDAGDDDFPKYKPNYLSPMSYNWEFRTAWPIEIRQQRAMCLPFYYADPDAKEESGSVPADVNTIVDYSEGMARPLVRPTSFAAGSASFCGTTIDWTTIDSALNRVEDFANWRALVFDGPAKNGSLDP